MLLWVGVPCRKEELIRMAHSGTVQPKPRISGQIIIDENDPEMELGRLELGYSILVPALRSV